MVSTAYTVGAWALIVGLAAACFFSKQSKSKSGLKIQPSLLSSKHQQPPTEPRQPKAKKQRTEAKKDRKEKEKIKEEDAAPRWLSNSDEKVNEKVKEAAIDDRELAKQFINMKTGTKFDRHRDDSASRHKSVKQSRAQVVDFDAAKTTAVPEDKVSSVSGVSAPSSSAGADDSPATSPLVAPADTAGVADMLEPPPAAPNVLRLIDTEETTRKENLKPKAEIKENKKARQNRKKAQQAKESREAQDLERKQKMEAQRRLARVSEGRAAKDGSQFMASINSGKSVWDPETKTGSAEAPAVKLLDTFDEAPAPGPALAAARAAVSKSTPSTSSNWLSSLPSEEEQIKMAQHDTEWSTVAAKSSRKSVKKEAKEAPASPTDAATAPPAFGIQPSAPNGRPTKALRPTGSFAALSTNDDEEVEEEWDV